MRQVISCPCVDPLFALFCVGIGTRVFRSTTMERNLSTISSGNLSSSANHMKPTFVNLQQMYVFSFVVGITSPTWFANILDDKVNKTSFTVAHLYETFCGRFTFYILSHTRILFSRCFGRCPSPPRHHFPTSSFTKYVTTLVKKNFLHFHQCFKTPNASAVEYPSPSGKKPPYSEWLNLRDGRYNSSITLQ